MLSAILLAAGKSRRFLKRQSKVLSGICAKPVIYYSLSVLNKHPKVDEIIVVASLKNIKEIALIIRKYKIGKAVKVVLGGGERKYSVYNGLKVLSPDTDYVLIHDGARPFINSKMISSSILAARKHRAAVVGVPEKHTIKEIGRRKAIKTLNRESLWEIQTPQVFKKDIILKAYQNISGYNVTDDAMLVERLGIRPAVVLGSYSNIKITTPEDLTIAEAILKEGL